MEKDLDEEDAKPSAVDKKDDEEESSISAAAEVEESPVKSVKKRTWKKPKDKPKRPLSAYNIFFQHARTRIVEGQPEEASPEEIVRSIERILSKSREKRRHRKSHGRISFGDLARAIADQWKSINQKAKEIFDHYAEVDMIRYRREVKVWKEKKELESEANAMAKHSNFINQMSNSFNSTSSEVDDFPEEGISGDRRAMHESFNSSYSSTGDSASSGRRRMQQDSMNLMIQRQQQILRQQLHPGSNDFDNAAAMNNNRNTTTSMNNNNLPGSQAFHQSFSSLPGDFEPSSGFQMPQTMQQLQMQQQRQLEQMRMLQMQQFQIQQQIEMEQNKFQQNATGNNMNNMYSSFNSDMRSPPFLTPRPSQVPLKAQSSSASTSLDQSLHLGDAFRNHQSAHVSDYSNSHASGSGFASTRSLGGMSFSEGTMVGSFNNDMQIQQLQQHQLQMQERQQLQLQQQVFMQQQQNSFTGPFVHVDANQDNTGFNLFSSNNQQQDEKRRHDLRDVMHDTTGMED